MPENHPLDEADYALIKSLLNEHDIDAADPERLERLVLKMFWHREPKPAGRPVGRPYGKVVEDFFILKGIGNELAKLTCEANEKRGGAQPKLTKSGAAPSVTEAAKRLVKKAPFKFWGMSAERIRKRHGAMIERLTSGEGLQAELESLRQKHLNWLANDIRQQAQRGKK